MCKDECSKKFDAKSERCKHCNIAVECYEASTDTEQTNYTSVEDVSHIISGSEHDLNDDEIDALLEAST